ncbi:MAG: class I SAM-dependent methyltransferase, partial [Bryobacterales bacterium]|nr:class I SAM-dependent methyltransferase [Bryobacterales bacterium]
MAATAHELYVRSAAFWERLEAVKRSRAATADVDWYRYCSLANFEHFVPLLGGGADFAALVGAGPVLDIGCADGDLAFFVESEFGVAVHALDHAGTNHNGLRGARALRERLGSRIEILDQNLDEGFELPARPYSMAFCLGLLYHVKNPFHLLESIGRYARTCLLSTRVMRAFPGGAAVPAYPAAYLLDADELNCDETNFWIFNEAGLRRLAARAGWQVERFHTVGATDGDPDSLDRDARAFCLLRARRWLANVELGEGWHEESAEGWRWTAGRFTFTLPAGDWRRLTLRFHVPEALSGRWPRVTLAGLGELAVDGPGAYALRVELPEFSGGLAVTGAVEPCVAPSAA